MISSSLLFRLANEIRQNMSIIQKLYYNILFTRLTGGIYSQYILVILNYIPKEEESLLMFSFALDLFLSCLLLDLFVFPQKNKSYFLIPSNSLALPDHSSVSTQISVSLSSDKVFSLTLALIQLPFFLLFTTKLCEGYTTFTNLSLPTAIWFLTPIAFLNVTYNL